jgi:hypothetical protein
MEREVYESLPNLMNIERDEDGKYGFDCDWCSSKYHLWIEFEEAFDIRYHATVSIFDEKCSVLCLEFTKLEFLKLLWMHAKGQQEMVFNALKEIGFPTNGNVENNQQ